MQPNRPGKDIVLSSASPTVASLALACMPACRTTSGSLAGGRRGAAAPGSLQLHTTGSFQDMLALVPGHDGSTAETSGASNAEAPLLAVYLTSPTMLSALELNVRALSAC